MKKSLTFNLLCVAILTLLCCAAVKSQEETSSWVKVAPSGEEFKVSMPQRPSTEAAKPTTGGLDVAGRRYRAQEGDFTYTIWSFKIKTLPAGLRRESADSYLDLCGELAWDMLIEPEHTVRGRSRAEAAKYGLNYDSELASDALTGRNYWLRLGAMRGAIQVYATDKHIYLVSAWGIDETAPSINRFFESFALPAAPRVAKKEANTVGAVGGGSKAAKAKAGPDATKEVDYKRVFSAREVTQKAIIHAKAEPLYTEWARRFQITGVVRIRLILLPSGEVGGLTAVKKLAHGLTPAAIKAARGIKFTPAMKDGRPVAQYVTIEYNFNIY